MRIFPIQEIDQNLEAATSPVTGPNPPLSSVEGRGVCGCDSITHTGSDHELSRQSIYESISYHDAILGRRGKRERGGLTD